MKLKEIYNSQKPVISYEIFPPKGQPEEMPGKISALMQELNELAAFDPSFISVTYGAGGSTRDKTLELVLKIKNELNIKPLPHFTCVGTEKDEILHYLKEVQDSGIEDIFALRGDPPQGQEKFIKPENGFGYANELVKFIRMNSTLGIAVAGYPEGHLECESLEKDLFNLKQKVEAGADIVVTQLFYNNALFFDFVDKARNIGINVPIVPGILPITNFSQVERMTSMCGCTIPDELFSKLKRYQDDNNSIKAIGLEYATQQCSDLISNNVPGIHFYTLNKAFAVKSVLQNLNLNTTLI
jgi:methylenetetrahydrofolate reductase (NADPH)